MVELQPHRLLVDGLIAAVECKLRHDRCIPGGLRDVLDFGQCALRDIQPHADLGDALLVARDAGEMLAQADRQAALEAESCIVVGAFTGAELALQRLQLIAHVDRGLYGERGRKTEAGNRHDRLTSSSAVRGYRGWSTSPGHWRRRRSAGS